MDSNHNFHVRGHVQVELHTYKDQSLQGVCLELDREVSIHFPTVQAFHDFVDKIDKLRSLPINEMITETFDRR